MGSGGGNAGKFPFFLQFGTILEDLNAIKPESEIDTFLREPCKVTGFDLKP